MSSTTKNLSTLLTGLQVLAMTALTLIDVVGVVNFADFMVRPDGSRQVPDDMLPFERVLVSMIAFPFLCVLLGFLLCPRKNAALLAATIHGSYTLHQIVFYDTWQALFHPESDLTMEFFIYSKVVWVVVSLIIYSGETFNESDAKAKAS